MDIHDAILAILDTHYPHIESWQRIVWCGWMVNHWRFGLYPNDPSAEVMASLWVIVQQAQNGDLFEFDALFKLTRDWWQGKVRAGCLPRIRQGSLSYQVLSQLSRD